MKERERHAVYKLQEILSFLSWQPCFSSTISFQSVIGFIPMNVVHDKLKEKQLNIRDAPPPKKKEKKIIHKINA